MTSIITGKNIDQFMQETKEQFDIESEIGAGTTVTIVFPADRVLADSQSA